MADQRIEVTLPQEFFDDLSKTIEGSPSLSPDAITRESSNNFLEKEKIQKVDLHFSNSIAENYNKMGFHFFKGGSDYFIKSFFDYWDKIKKSQNYRKVTPDNIKLLDDNKKQPSFNNLSSNKFKEKSIIEDLIDKAMNWGIAALGAGAAGVGFGIYDKLKKMFSGAKSKTVPPSPKPSPKPKITPKTNSKTTSKPKVSPKRNPNPKIKPIIPQTGKPKPSIPKAANTNILRKSLPLLKGIGGAALKGLNWLSAIELGVTPLGDATIKDSYLKKGIDTPSKGFTETSLESKKNKIQRDFGHLPIDQIVREIFDKSFSSKHYSWNQSKQIEIEFDNMVNDVVKNGINKYYSRDHKFRNYTAMESFLADKNSKKALPLNQSTTERALMYQQFYGIMKEEEQKRKKYVEDNKKRREEQFHKQEQKKRGDDASQVREKLSKLTPIQKKEYEQFYIKLMNDLSDKPFDHEKQFKMMNDYLDKVLSKDNKSSMILEKILEHIIEATHKSRDTYAPVMMVNNIGGNNGTRTQIINSDPRRNSI